MLNQSPLLPPLAPPSPAPATPAIQSRRHYYARASIAILALAATIATSHWLGGHSAKGPLWVDRELDSRATFFLTQEANLADMPYCVPILVGQTRLLHSFYLSCQAEALSQDTIPSEVSSDFLVPAALARRVHFWQRVYSLWSIHNYVIHAGDYPEIVFEVMDVSHLVRPGYDPANDKEIRRAVTETRQLYSRVLMSMHLNRDQPEVFAANPTTRRLAKILAPIDDPEKYLHASESLRVQRGQMDYIRQAIIDSARYLPAIEEIFASQGLPTDLAKLAFVESSFNIRAESKVGAAGVYQIMPETGAQYMRVTEGIDERYDPIKAGKAAAKLLTMYYRLTETWPLAITAYNHGVGSIRRAVAQTGSNDIVTLIQSYEGPSFGFASKNFYAGFLAMLGTLANRDTLFPDLDLAEPLAYVDTRITDGRSISEVAARYKTSPTRLRSLNLDIRRGFANDEPLPSGYVLKLPPTAAPAIAKKGSR